MFDVAIFFEKMVALIPAGATFIACASWVFASYQIIDRIDLSVAQSLEWISQQIVNANLLISGSSANASLALRILHVAGINDGLDALIYLTTYLSLLSETILLVLGVLTTGIIAVWVYRKTKLACGIVSGTGVAE